MGSRVRAPPVRPARKCAAREAAAVSSATVHRTHARRSPTRLQPAVRGCSTTASKPKACGCGTTRIRTAMDNAAIARILREIADLLEIRDDNPFKIRAYRNGADIASNHPHELSQLDEVGLREIPGIGKDLASRIREIAQTG